MGTLLDLASLVTIPSGYKVGTVYSVVPTDGAGDLTFTRSNDTATRVGPNGLIEKVRTNFKIQSEQLTIASGGLSATDITTITANTTDTLDPFGTNKAEKFDGTSGQLADTYNAILNNGANTSSIYAKAGTATSFDLRMSGAFGISANAVFNLSNGTITSTGGGQYISSSIVSVGNGWYRCSISYNFLTIPTNRILLTANGSLYFFGWQLEASDFGPTPYIPTTTTAVSVGPVANLPRLDYLNSTCPNLLLEPQRTNLITSSERFDVMSQSNLTVTANNATSPDGYTNADRLTPSGSGFHTIGNSISVTAGTPYTISFFYKNFDHKNIGFYDNNTSGSEISINVQDNTFTLGANVTAGGVISYGNGWYRAYATFSPSTTLMNNLIIFRDNTNNGNYTATGSYIWAYGWQVEAGAYGTSYVPTLGAASTRGADFCVKNSATALIGQTEGTIYWEGIIDAFPTDNSFFGVQKTSTSAVIRFGSGGINVYAQVYNGSTNLFFEPTSYTLGTFVKLGFAYKAGSYAFYKNGTLVAVGTNATTIPACDEVMTNSLWGNVGNGKYSSSEAIIFPTRLSNSELAQLTTI
jgi:hypothetical protein